MVNSIAKTRSVNLNDDSQRNLPETVDPLLDVPAGNVGPLTSCRSRARKLVALSSPALLGRSVFEDSPLLSKRSNSARVLVIVGVGGRTRVIDEVGGIEGSRNSLEDNGRMGKVETIGKIVRRSIRIAERGQVERGLNEFEDAAEVVRSMRNVSGFSVG